MTTDNNLGEQISAEHRISDRQNYSVSFQCWPDLVQIRKDGTVVYKASRKRHAKINEALKVLYALLDDTFEQGWSQDQCSFVSNQFHMSFIARARPYPHYHIRPTMQTNGVILMPWPNETPFDLLSDERRKELKPHEIKISQAHYEAFMELHEKWKEVPDAEWWVCPFASMGALRDYLSRVKAIVIRHKNSSKRPEHVAPILTVNQDSLLVYNERAKEEHIALPASLDDIEFDQFGFETDDTKFKYIVQPATFK